MKEDRIMNIPSQGRRVTRWSGGQRRAQAAVHLRRWAVVALLLIPLLAACSPAAEQSKPVTIKFAHPNSDVEAYKALATEFKKSNASITIDLLARDPNGLNQLQPTEVDCFTNSNQVLPELMAGQKIRSLDPWIESDKTFKTDDFYPGALPLFQGDGKTWGVPVGMDPFVLYYNKDLFDKAGVPYPTASWTWDDFLQAATKIAVPDSGVFGFITRSVADPALFVYQHDGKLVDNWDNPTRAMFDDPLTLEALEWWDALTTVHKVSPSATQMQGAFRQAEAAILQGKIGMWFGQFSERGGLAWGNDSKWQIPWGMAPLPRDKQAASIAMADGYFISSKTTMGDACWKWISYLSAKSPGRLAPARKSVLQSETFAKQIGPEVAATARAALQQAILIRSLDSAPYQKIGNPFMRAIDQIMRGTATVRDAMTAAQAATQ
jgi:multiple sugar transport system substrate-binding protein